MVISVVTDHVSRNCSLARLESVSIVLNIYIPRKTLSVVPESIEHGLRMWEMGSLVPSRVKPIMTYKIDVHRFLARHSALIG